jgi:hypothetical protein
MRKYNGAANLGKYNGNPDNLCKKFRLAIATS